jgi:hypothetical protein
MGIIGTIFIGLIVGLLARFLKPGDDSMGWIMTILLGIAGSWPPPMAGRPGHLPGRAGGGLLRGPGRRDHPSGDLRLHQETLNTG